MKERVFAKGTGFQKLSVIFIIFSIVGCYYEMILNLVNQLLIDGTIFWEIRSGVIYGPFSIIYGFGAALMTKILANKGYKWYKVLIYGAILGGVCEYGVSLLQELFTGTTSWDYSHHILNINGRTTLPIMFAWGVMCLVYIMVVYPFISKYIEKLPYKICTIGLNIILILLSFDMFISASAVVRQYLRKNNIEPYTFYGQFLDKHYPDEVIKKAYPNMKQV